LSILSLSPSLTSILLIHRKKKKSLSNYMRKSGNEALYWAVGSSLSKKDLSLNSEKEREYSNCKIYVQISWRKNIPSVNLKASAMIVEIFRPHAASFADVTAASAPPTPPPHNHGTPTFYSVARMIFGKMRKLMALQF